MTASAANPDADVTKAILLLRRAHKLLISEATEKSLIATPRRLRMVINALDALQQVPWARHED